MADRKVPEVDRIAANRAAVAIRRERAELKRQLSSGELSHIAVLDAVEAGTSPKSWRTTRVEDFLGTVRGVGEIGVARASELMGFKEGKRLGGIGRIQRIALDAWLRNRLETERILGDALESWLRNRSNTERTPAEYSITKRSIGLLKKKKQERA